MCDGSGPWAEVTASPGLKLTRVDEVLASRIAPDLIDYCDLPKERLAVSSLRLRITLELS